MMDIVKQLRSYLIPITSEPPLLRQMLIDAADEIEHLRSTIEQLRSIAGAANIDRSFSEIKKEARS